MCCLLWFQIGFGVCLFVVVVYCLVQFVCEYECDCICQFVVVILLQLYVLFVIYFCQFGDWEDQYFVVIVDCCDVIVCWCDWLDDFQFFVDFGCYYCFVFVGFCDYVSCCYDEVVVVGCDYYQFYLMVGGQQCDDVDVVIEVDYCVYWFVEFVFVW